MRKLCLSAFSILLCSIALAATTGSSTATRSAHRPEMKPCASTCSHDATQVAAYNSAGECVHAFTYPCSPYACDSDGKTCNNNCESNQDCAGGATCNVGSGTCVHPYYSCTDAFTVLNSDGHKTSCLPYKCVNGGCQQQCVNPSDCGDGYACTNSHCTKK